MHFGCEASGFPAPTILWTKGDKRLEGGRFSVSVSGHLTIQPVGFEDAGEYTCEAMNSAGIARKTATLLIQGGNLDIVYITNILVIIY